MFHNLPYCRTDINRVGHFETLGESLLGYELRKLFVVGFKGFYFNLLLGIFLCNTSKFQLFCTLKFFIIMNNITIIMKIRFIGDNCFIN